MITETLKLDHFGRAPAVFHDNFIFFTTGYALIRIGDTLIKRVLTILM